MFTNSDESHRLESIRDQGARHLLRVLQKMRVTCFSATSQSILMWSHYADQHRGVVLAFDPIALLEGWEVSLFQAMQYSDKFPECVTPEAWARRMLFQDQLDLTFDHKAFVLAKATSWAYEEEWRALWPDPVELGDSSDQEFPRGALKGLVFGCRTDHSRARELCALALGVNPECTFEVASKSASRFELEFKPFTLE